MRRETLFRIASLTKPILAAATMMLVEDGPLKLDDPVDRWLPELANRRVLRHIAGPLEDTGPAGRPITLDDLLTLRLGFGTLVEPTFDPPFPIVIAANALQLVLSQPDPRTPHSPDEWIKRFGTLPLMYQPGERWQYNVGSLVLGVLVARAAGQSVGEFFRTRIFEPLGMRQTGFWLPAELTQSLPSYYMTNFETGRLEVRPVSTPDEWTRPPAFPSGAGGLVSTVDDFLAFARLLLNKGVHDGHRLLSEKSVELMNTNHLTADQIAGGGILFGGRGWGFGMGVVTEPDPDWPVPGRYGWSGGYGTTWFNDPPPRHRRHRHDPDERLPLERRTGRVRKTGRVDLNRLPKARLPAYHEHRRPPRSVKRVVLYFDGSPLRVAAGVELLLPAHRQRSPAITPEAKSL